MAESDWTWYVEPRDEHTNEVISRTLSATGDAIGNEEFDLIDSAGRSFNAWRVDYALVSQLGRASGLSFRVYAQAGKGATIREWKFSRPRRRSKKAEAVREQVAALQQGR